MQNNSLREAKEKRSVDQNEQDVDKPKEWNNAANQTVDYRTRTQNLYKRRRHKTNMKREHITWKLLLAIRWIRRKITGLHGRDRSCIKLDGMITEPMMILWTRLKTYYRARSWDITASKSCNQLIDDIGKAAVGWNASANRRNISEWDSRRVAISYDLK